MQRLQKLKQLLIRYARQSRRHLHRKGKSVVSFRKARTRTLIQAGGLLEKARLLEVLRLSPGDDLQKNEECFEGVAILMGALAEIRQSLLGEEGYTQRTIWYERGKKALETKNS